MKNYEMSIETSVDSVPIVNLSIHGPAPCLADIAIQKGDSGVREIFKEVISELTGQQWMYCLPSIDQVVFNETDKVTVVIWADGEKTIVRCGEGEAWDRYTGFMAAVCKRLFGGTTTAKKLMNAKDKGYQAKLKAEAIAKEKEKRAAEAKEAKKKADQRRDKEFDRMMDDLIKYYMVDFAAQDMARRIMNGEDEPENTSADGTEGEPDASNC